MTLVAVGYLTFLLGIWLGSKAWARQRLYDAWSEGYTAATRHFVQMHEAMKAAKPEGDVHWIESGWYRFDLEAPSFRTLDAVTVDDYLAQDLRQSVPGEPRENPHRQDILGDPDE